jgi:ferrous iron transport protein B
MTGTPPLVALVGNPNSGKSSLFNALTGARQKIANYPGVTVERKSGRTALPDGRPVELLDLPGAYSLQPDSLDEAVTRDVILGKLAGQRRPDALVIVVDAGNLDNHLRFAIELIGQGLPVVIALNMIDLAERDGLEIDPTVLADELGVPVVSTVAVRKRGQGGWMRFCCTRWAAWRYCWRCCLLCFRRYMAGQKPPLAGSKRHSRRLRMLSTRRCPTVYCGLS